jgi:hypothetical protein
MDTFHSQVSCAREWVPSAKVLSRCMDTFHSQVSCARERQFSEITREKIHSLFSRRIRPISRCRIGHFPTQRRPTIQPAEQPARNCGCAADTTRDGIASAQNLCGKQTCR